MRSARGIAYSASALPRYRRCYLEALEERRLMAADVAPQVVLGSVYFEEATGDDSLPDLVQVSFEGGAAGTQLTRLVIDGDKDGLGLSTGDVFFDIAAGGLGAFGDVGFSIVSHNGFTVDSVAVVDGGTQIVFTFSGFDAGEVFEFSIDVDEAQYVGGGDVDTNALVEGGEFQRSTMTGTFTAPHFVDLNLKGTYWDAFDVNFAAAQTATGLTLDLPNDAYSLTHDYTDRTAGAVVYAAQIPLATIAGWVYHDRDDDGSFDTPAEEGIGGVTLELLKDGVGTGITTTTSTTAGNVGYYEFIDLLPGNYGVREVQPGGWLDGKDTAGSHGGSVTNDRISGAVLDFGDHGINYNFGELLPGSIAGRVILSQGAGCDFEDPQAFLEDIQIDLLDADGKVLATTYTNAHGEYLFTGLAPGEYQVREHQPAEYYDGGEHVGTAGGSKYDVPNQYSIFTGINITSDLDAVHYDFCEHIGANLAGWVYHDRSNEGDFNRPGEEGIGGVTVELLLNGVVVGTTVTATSAGNVGYYQFTNLAPGTYTVREVQPTGWLDGKDREGSHGGVASNDLISQIVLDFGDDAVEYNFGELLPGSIRGRVHADKHDDCDFDDPDILLAGVRIDLLDGSGNVLATTFTNQDGEYAFTGLAPGAYQVREHQPIEYFDGGERVGTAGGSAYDIAEQFSIFTGIHITSGLDTIQYDFCEKIGAMLSGHVYHDRSNDGIYTPASEEGIAGVVVKLLDEHGVDTGLRATTDATGFYKFSNLRAGKYSVMEVHPSGWLDGIDTPGSLGGTAAGVPGDMISLVMITWGDMGTDYNFGELLPGSIRGQVVTSTDPECDPDDGEPPIAGVRIDLLDAGGNVIATTLTDANGEYAFTGLRPGVYSVREHQPGGYFDLDAHVGDGGGVRLSTNLLGDIPIDSDEHLTNYDFCEGPPAEISGYVYLDGAPLVANDALTPQEIYAQRNGVRTPDDKPLAGIVLELRDGTTGAPIDGADVLPGTYAAGPIRTTTDANGFYHFVGLAAGNYAIVEVQPGEYVDNRDQPGLTGGYAVNPAGIPLTRDGDAATELIPPDVADVIEYFRSQFGDNAIVQIPLATGQHSQENNFSEVQVFPVIIWWPPEEPLPPEPPVYGGPTFPYLPLAYKLPPLPTRIPDWIGGSSKALGYTWHLSVVNAGQPRSVRELTTVYRLTAAPVTAAAWTDVPLDAGHWTLGRFEGGNVSLLREATFGTPDGRPVAGDFNGDGVWDVGVFRDGRWYLDLNGNGVWDQNDLWAKLGTETDLPVTGDWDDDGKTDIGIYGPAWARDPWAVQHEPGLPDAENYPTQPSGHAKNVPPTADEATSGGRLLKRTAQGKPRADLIDHVFLYGAPGDVPITGDWDGDGIRAIGVFRDGGWALDLDGDGRFTDADGKFTFGQPGDLPVVGDFNGDGVDEIGVYRAGRWIIDTNGNRQIDAQDMVFTFGSGDPGEVPVVGDWDGDGTSDPAVYKPGVAADRISRRAG